ncbi:DUF937 domain-containing protein [Armatimonas sp.]|uniref:DUF937 domain-containing protein n=1 Tax=Armatimonas sp. TaxID=1872638 RepID=UPI003753263B
MDTLLQGLMGQLSGSAVGQIAEQLGVDEGTAQNGIQAALPILLGALVRNAQSEDGAQSLDNALASDHDGSILDNLSGAISGHQEGPGAAILGHILGGQTNQISNVVGQSLGGANGGALLQMLAPIVMGYLGQQKQQQGLDVMGLAGMLLGGGGSQQQQAQPAASGMIGMVGQLLDQNHDGSPVDDIIGLAGRFLKR